MSTQPHPTQWSRHVQHQRRSGLLARVWVAAVLGALLACAIYGYQALQALTQRAGV